MKLTKKVQLILKMAEKANKHFTIGGKNSPHTMFDGERIFLQTKTQNEMIEKMSMIFFNHELEEMYTSLGMEYNNKNESEPEEMENDNKEEMINKIDEILEVIELNDVNIKCDNIDKDFFSISLNTYKVEFENAYLTNYTTTNQESINLVNSFLSYSYKSKVKTPIENIETLITSKVSELLKIVELDNVKIEILKDANTFTVVLIADDDIPYNAKCKYNYFNNEMDIKIKATQIVNNFLTFRELKDVSESISIIL